MTPENRLIPQIWADASNTAWDLMEENRRKPWPETGVAWDGIPLTGSEQDMSSKRTWLLQDLRTIREHLEKAVDELREMNRYSLQLADVSLQRAEEALEAINKEIDTGTSAQNHVWPKRRDDEVNV
jgi:hypothetical protein